jgi:hypothetical protein
MAIIHAGLAAAWVGGMAYSLFVVQPKLKKYFATREEEREALTAVIASGNRYKVLGLIATIAVTGLILLLLDHRHWWIHAGGWRLFRPVPTKFGASGRRTRQSTPPRLTTSRPPAAATTR